MQIDEGIENVLMNMVFQKQLKKKPKSEKFHASFMNTSVWPVPLTQVWTHQNINSTKPEASRSFQQHQRHITIPSTWIEW